MWFNGSCIITEDVVSLAKFYDLILGTTSDINEVHTNINIKGSVLTIYNKTAAKRDMNLEIDGMGNKIILQFIVQDIDVLYRHICGIDVKIINTPRIYPWGAKSMQIKDIDGNIISFASYVD